VYCTKCAYSLAGLIAGQCPECGRKFDPGRPSTFFTTPHGGIDRTLWRTALIPILLPWAPVLLSHVSLLLARIELGRWPHRYGMDDPKGITSLAFLGGPLILSIAAGMVFAPCAALTLVGWSIGKGRVRIAAHILLACTVSYAGALLFNRWDPADVWVWIAD
jgi:hypothetical protein